MAEQDKSLTPVEVVSSLQEITKAEIDIQISTAKKYPRSINSFRQEAETMATLDMETAASCFYKLLRKNREGEKSFIEGPSVRLAEIVASAWGNIRFGARIVSEDEKFVTAQGVAHDLEKNVCNTIEVTRRITGRDGKRFSEDMIVVTKNAACSIALRNAIFKTIPFTYAKQIYVKAKKTAVGNSKTLIERRQQMLSEFQKMGVSPEQILIFVEKKSVEDLGLSEVETMIGVFTAIRDGDTTVDEQFNQAKAGKPDVEMPKAVTPQEPKKEEATTTAQKTDNVRLVTESQLKRLYAIKRDKKVNDAVIADFIAAKFKLSSEKELNRYQYDEVCAAVLSGNLTIADRQPGEEG